ncbi:MAG: hypothetical protein HC859_07660 [Bacteroidia bacterium]|nr:hypothetical protein [Bacteroidia bacterium]
MHPRRKDYFTKPLSKAEDFGLRFNDQEVMQRVAASVLAELKLTPSSVDSIQSVPFPQLAAAGKNAIAKVQQQLVAEGKPVTPLVGLTWGPTLDHAFLFHNPTDSGATAAQPTCLADRKHQELSLCLRVDAAPARCRRRRREATAQAAVRRQDG